MRGLDVIELRCTFCQSVVGHCSYADWDSTASIACNRGECIDQIVDEVEGP